MKRKSRRRRRRNRKFCGSLQELRQQQHLTGIPIALIALLVIIVIIGSITLGKKGSEKNAEEVWEPPIVIESAETVKEDEFPGAG